MALPTWEHYAPRRCSWPPVRLPFTSWARPRAFETFLVTGPAGAGSAAGGSGLIDLA
jgi:hypothetical protein